MEYRVRVNLLSTAIIVALGIVVSLVTSTVVASRAYQKRAKLLSRDKQVITVKGYARQRVTSDLGDWHITVFGEAAELKDAFEQLDGSVVRVRDFIAEQGFTSDETLLQAIRTETHFVRDEHGKTTRQVDSYTLSRTVIVSSTQVQRITEAAADVTALIRDDIRLTSHLPQFTLSTIGTIKMDLLGAASADARNRAEQIASKSGCTIGAVRNARMGVIQITQPNSTEVRSYGIYDTSTIEKDISVVMTITFGVE